MPPSSVTTSDLRQRVVRVVMALLLLAATTPAMLRAQTTLAEWNFENQALTPGVSIPANAASTLSVHGGASYQGITSVGIPTGSYAYANSWSNGSGTKYWRINVSTAGYTSITISSLQWSESTFFSHQGPRDFKIQYSLDNSTWVDVSGGAYALNIDYGQFGWKTRTITNLALPTACENQATLYIRWLMNSNTGANGSDPVSAGQNLIDNIIVRGVGGGGGNTAPTISSITTQATNEDAPTGAIAFTVDDAQTAAGSLTVSAVSSNTALVPNANIALGGSGANRTITLTPSANASGATTVTVTVSDGSLSASTNFTLNVNAVNDAPTISTIAAQATNEDTPTGAIAFTVGDVETAAASLSVSASSSNPTLVPNANITLGGSGANRTITLAPAANITGATTITVTVSDGSLSASTNFTLNVNAVNDAPTISTITAQATNEDTPTGAIAFTVDDVDNAAGTLSVSAVSSNTALVPNANIALGGSGNSRSITLTPLPNANGSTSVTVTVNDGSLSASTNFTLTVNAVNDAPTISAIAAQVTNEDTPTGAIAFTVGDVETAAASLGVSASSSNTTLVPNANITLGGSGANRNITLSPAVNASGATTITVTVSDGSVTSSSIFILTVNAVNDAPTLAGIEAANLVYNEGAAATALTATLTADDIDNTMFTGATVWISQNFIPSEDVLEFTNTATITGNFAGGTLQLTGVDSKANYTTALRNVRYRNSNNVLPNTAVRMVSYQVNDGAALSAVAKRGVQVVEINDPPVAEAGPNQSQSCVRPTGTAVTLNGAASFDIENDPLTYTWKINNAVVATGVSPTINLLPATHVVTLEVNDGRGGIATDNVTITLIPDVTPPQITAPANITVNTTTGLCSATPSIGMATATDNCPWPITISNNAPVVFPKGVTIVVWTAVDGSGNSSSANQTVTVQDRQNPTISGCAPTQTVEGNAQNTAVMPDFRALVSATDNCTATANLVRTQTPAPGTTMAAGVHNVTITIGDADLNSSSCVTTFTVTRRPEIAPVAPVVVVSGACKTATVTSESVVINNSGGNFAGGQMMWNASTSASEITLLNSSGMQGQALQFTVDPRSLLTPGSYLRTITITAYNANTMSPATNSPFNLTVRIDILPIGTVTVTQAVGTTWTPFVNSLGQTIAEVKSNNGTIQSFSVSMTPCTMPQGITRIRYVNRTYTMSTTATNPNVDVRLFYTSVEAASMITNPSALTVWSKPSAMWVDRGGTSDIYLNRVQVNGLTNLAGQFALAHGWFAKSRTLAIQRASYDAATATAQLEWTATLPGEQMSYIVESREEGEETNWSHAATLTATAGEQLRFADALASGARLYRVFAIDADGRLYESPEVRITASALPTEVTLEQNYPNPFNPSTAIRFSVGQSMPVVLTVHDAQGTVVATLVDREVSAGQHTVQFDASTLPSGTYFSRLRAGTTLLTRPMLLVK